MTADAKVGLLLGLFFIAIIAFLVNGLPNFIRQEHPAPAEAAIRTPSAPDMVLDIRLDKPHRFNPSQQQTTHDQQPTVTVADTSTQHVPEVVFTRTRQSTQTASVNQLPQQVTVPAAPIEINSSDLNNINPEPIVVKKIQTHTVNSGEMLSTIAKTYYGDDRGNTLAVIKKLYEANKKVLSSPDQVNAGDTLVIPSWEQLMGTSAQPAQSAQANQTVQAVQAQTAPVNQQPTESNTLLSKYSDVLKKVIGKDKQSVSEYVVREHDSLWSIAEEKLGDGNRYKEIARLNKIKNADSVSSGVRIKIPDK